jgi:hypothetical protein
VAKIAIKNIKEGSLGSNHPPTVLEKAIEDNEIYVTKDVYDGGMWSDVALVPYSRLGDVEILGWKFVGDKDFYFETLDEFFGEDLDLDDEDSYDEDGNLYESITITQNTIESFVSMVEGDISYFLKIPEFKEYYDSKETG